MFRETWLLLSMNATFWKYLFMYTWHTFSGNRIIEYMFAIVSIKNSMDISSFRDDLMLDSQSTECGNKN